MNNLLRPAFMLMLVMTVLTGAIYPAIVTGLAQLLFAHTANGSVIVHDGKPLGSELIGQPFSAPRYFWSRPSTTAPFADNSASSSGSNLGPTNPALADAVRQRIEALRRADPGNIASVPADLVTASGSGLDPHISPAAANYQIERVARVRGLAPAEVASLVALATEGRLFGVLGEPRVNVLKLNLALDGK